MSDAHAEWARLSRPWQLAFEEAWASWRSGSAAVGAAITDADGTIVAAGRNRMVEARDDSGQLAGTPMAHAEMNALAGLPRSRRRTGLTLYTTFEPCFMCYATIIGTFRIPKVAFAAHDPVWDGLHDSLNRLPILAPRIPERELLGGPFGAFALVVHLTWLVEHVDDPFEAHQRLVPGHLALARWLAESSALQAIGARSAGPADAAAGLWADLLPLADR